MVADDVRPSPRLHEPVEVHDYEPFIGREAVDRIHRKGRALEHLRVVNLNSTFYGGDVAELQTPQRVLWPTIDPFTINNKPMTDDETRKRLDHYDIPTDLPLVVQISRFDRWKDPEGVIEAFKTRLGLDRRPAGVAGTGCR